MTLERYFVMSAHDDPRGVAITMGVQPGTRTFLHFIAATPAVVSIVDSTVAAGVAGMVALLVDLPALGALAIAVVTFAVAVWAHLSYGRRNYARVRSWQPLFPST